ncbi:DinB family protein [Cytophagaceae bacterium 50C-KIRBA]|uniref:DinB family protein n=1 Tax=Aquirufa beregesia TaxID=2516556 RepID=A0ABX0EVT5_9BACT|nr:DinB family protein [Aquirufa beregesia]NGZ44554.1 DinB family protein [Aquirufa beregesia]
MQQEKWFERHFQFGNTQQIFPSILERLSGTSIRLTDKLIGASEKILTQSEGNSWSIKENIGHLIDLEPLWQGRIEDILSGQTQLRYTDLDNSQTHSANHNATSIHELVDSFKRYRLETIQMLQTLQPENLLQSALHPRLKIPMNLQDHLLFVADHDDHHLAAISQLLHKTP